MMSQELFTKSVFKDGEGGAWRGDGCGCGDARVGKSEGEGVCVVIEAIRDGVEAIRGERRSISLPLRSWTLSVRIRHSVAPFLPHRDVVPIIIPWIDIV